MFLAPIRLPHQGMYLASTTSQHLDIMHQSRCLGIVFSYVMESEGWAHLISIMIVAFARASSSEVKIYRDKKGWHLLLLCHF